MSAFIASSRALVAATRQLAASPGDEQACTAYDRAVLDLERLGQPTVLLDLLWWTVAAAEAATRVGQPSNIRAFTGFSEQLEQLEPSGRAALQGATS